MAIQHLPPVASEGLATRFDTVIAVDLSLAMRADRRGTARWPETHRSSHGRFLSSIRFEPVSCRAMLNIDDAVARISSDLLGRLEGPFSFRFVLQPLMAALYAVRDGTRDARAGRPAYFWSVLSNQRDRWELLREGEQAVIRVIAFGVVIDVIYQLVVLNWIYPIQLIVVVLGLAFVPYLLLRGPVNRIARHFIRGRMRG